MRKRYTFSFVAIDDRNVPHDNMKTDLLIAVKQMLNNYHGWMDDIVLEVGVTVDE